VSAICKQEIWGSNPRVCTPGHRPFPLDERGLLHARTKGSLAPSSKAVSRRSGRISTYSIDVPREQLLTVKQVAKELGVANTRVMTLVRRGDLAATRPGGPATWRIQRAQLDAYTERTRAEGVARQQRRQAKLVKSLSDAWARVSDERKRQLERDVPQDLYRPLTHLMDPKRQQRPADMAALVHAYRRRTDFGIEELALDMPDDLFWAVARLALGRE